MKMQREIIYEDARIKVETTGSDYDFIATVENKTNEPISVCFPTTELNFTLQPNDWLGLLADVEGELILELFKRKKFNTVGDWQWDDGTRIFEEVAV